MTLALNQQYDVDNHAYSGLLKALQLNLMSAEEVGAISTNPDCTEEVLKAALKRYSVGVRKILAGGDEARVVMVENDGYKAYVKFGDLMSSAMLRGSYEPHLTRFILSKINKGSTFVDIGANVGWYTLNVAAHIKKLGGGKVISFEPQPDVHENLQKSITESGFDNIVTLHEFALSNQQGTISMQKSELNSGGSFIGGNGIPDIEVRKFDSCLSEFDSVDLLKIDVEGAEPLFLEGATEFFKKHKPIVVAEIHQPKLIKIGKSSAREFIKAMERFGYSAYQFNRKSEQIRISDDLFDDKTVFDAIFMPV